MREVTRQEMFKIQQFVQGNRTIADPVGGYLVAGLKTNSAEGKQMEANIQNAEKQLAGLHDRRTELRGVIRQMTSDFADVLQEEEDRLHALELERLHAAEAAKAEDLQSVVVEGDPEADLTPAEGDQENDSGPRHEDSTDFDKDIGDDCEEDPDTDEE